jgi:hypothetical protein
MKYVKWAAPDKSTMAKSSSQMFAYVYGNGADFQNHEKRPKTETEDFFPDLP